MAESALARSLRRKRAVERAAIQYHGWGYARGGDTKLCPREYWKVSTPSQRAAAISLTEPIVQAFEAVMNGEPERIFVIAGRKDAADEVIRTWAGNRSDRRLKDGIYVHDDAAFRGLIAGPLDRLLWVPGDKAFDRLQATRDAWAAACLKRDVYIEAEVVRPGEDPDDGL